ncbi:hypothetical protein RJ639_037550 [Escallonia herrerae]|uniref:Reverse transcriptase Ty1/copia-type domain-containing protein n=1 Tax=Escallonia herrerae TaxID=1293975 RepID=A0AA89BFR9_9ASTE|nr:hypothetical protein RJ639_037550 [Escallonia herrerae]
MYTSDDCISIQTGCSNVYVRDVNCGPGHGISIGSLGKDGTKACVSNVTVRDVIMHNTMNGVRIKTWQKQMQEPNSCRGYISGITYEKIRGTYTVKPVYLACSDSLPCTGVTLNSIKLEPMQEGYHLYDPFCWQTFGELLSPTLPPVSCLQLGKPPSNHIQNDHEAYSTTPTSSVNKRFQKLLSRKFDMKDLGSAKKILSMEIHRDRNAGKLWVTMKSYVEKVLERFSMLNAKPVSTPLGAHFQLSSQLCPSTEEDIEYMSRVLYANTVGYRMYAMVCTRPDISHAVSMVSRYMGNPGKKHGDAVKWIFRHLAGSTNFGIMFDHDGAKGEVSGFVDSDYAGDLDSRRSTTGYIFTFYGGPICWKSVLQSTTTLSTTEAEYMALTEAAKEAL